MKTSNRKILVFSFLLLLFSFLCISTVSAADKQLSGVSLSANAFSPIRGEKVRFTYKLNMADKVTIGVYDADGGLVRSLVDTASREAGSHEVEWDGKDEDGKPVPDEAYMVTIETGSGAVYDPTTFSGGIVGDVTQAQFDAEAGTVVYKLPAAGRVLIRCGLHNGPMVKTLVDWKPRIAGSITEYWDGRDEDKVFMVRGHKDFTALITYVTLPDATVIAYGNDQESYRDYKLGRAKDRLQKPAREREPDPKGQLRPENLVPPAWARAPRVLMTLPQHPQTDGAVPEVKENVDVRIDVDPSDRDYLLRDQFEVIFFVDNVFFTEAERGYLPLNWRWELNQLPPGEHVLTVNISSFKGQVGVASRKVRVVKGKP